MAANSGAYYEGLQYASQGVEPVKFGELSMGFAKIVEDKRLEEKRDREKKEGFQMEMTKLFGEEIYSAFDGTGLADADIVNAKIKDSIVARANVVNSLYENGKLTNAQMMQEMVKLNAQSSKYASFAGSISDKVKELQDLGGDASEYSRLMLDRLDELMREATPVMDSSGNLSFLSKDGEVINNNPFNELQKLLDVRKRYDTESIINSVVAARGQEQIIRGGQVIKKPRDIGEGDEKAFINVVNSLDDADMFDIAERAGVRVDRDQKYVFNITNKEEVRSGIVKYLKESAQAKINNLESIDEVAGESVQSQRRRDAAALGRIKAEDAPVKVDRADGGYDIIANPKTINSIKTSKPSGSDVTVSGYGLNEKGQHVVRVEYDSVEAIENTMDSAKLKQSETLVLDDLESINRVRVLYGNLPAITELPKAKKEESEPFIGPEQNPKRKLY